MVAKGPGGVRGRERSSAVPFCYFLTGARCSKKAENYYMRGDGGEVFSDFFGFIFIVFAVLLLLCRAMLSLSYIPGTYSISKEENKYLPGVYTYVRHAAFALFSCVEHGALGICKSSVCTELFGPSVPFHSSSSNG